ncbi:hypothetical protein Sjap_023093 [Stephania japonica]|uniref:Pseudouridine synthase I TruA alpha/beta domain-containing protein n=1 Tax=Stephania japonica TaxID=461633 RepID=A0AAP0EQ51_9MAGN
MAAQSSLAREGKAEMGSSIWEQIELSESYLVCCMFEEAVSLATSVLGSICGRDSSVLIEETELVDMMESTGMVLVQSLKELGRTSEIVNELKVLFGSATAIPIQVLLTGVCIQVSDGYLSGLAEFLDEFLGKWKHVNGQFYICAGEEVNESVLKGSDELSILEMEKYYEIAEIYAVVLLKAGSKNVDPVIVCIKKAELPDEKEKEFVERLQSLCSARATNLSKEAETPYLRDENTSRVNSSLEAMKLGFEESATTLTAQRSSRIEDHPGQTILSCSKRVEPWFWWYHVVTLKLGHAFLNISQRKILLWCSAVCSAVFAYYFLRKKHASIKQNTSRLVFSFKKALVDLWQLAFSVQVNPLAAIQPLPSVFHCALEESDTYLFGDFGISLVDIDMLNLYRPLFVETSVRDLSEIVGACEESEPPGVPTKCRTGRWARVTFKILLSYHGGSFDGWQKQPGLNTVQGLVERSIGSFVDEKTAQKLKEKSLPLEGCAAVAGRTDKGVTALNQVCAFHTWRKDVQTRNIKDAINSAAPGRLRAVSVSEVSREFHPNFSAKWRRYFYIFPFNNEDEEQNNESRKSDENSYWRDQYMERLDGSAELLGEEEKGECITFDDSESVETGTKPSRFSVDRVNQLLLHLEGRFYLIKCSQETRKLQEARPATECFIYHARAVEARLPSSEKVHGGSGKELKVMCVELVGNRFLRKMVRVLIATSIREAAAGAGDDALLRLMEATCRRATAPPAPPDGLCLMDVGYSEFNPANCLIK